MKKNYYAKALALTMWQSMVFRAGVCGGRK